VTAIGFRLVPLLMLVGCIGPEDRGEVVDAAFGALRENIPTNPTDWLGWLYAVGAAVGVGGAEWSRRYVKRKRLEAASSTAARDIPEGE
jgi:hypothetical protein